jgi:hypothetical protein
MPKTITPCPYALRDTVYLSCPRIVHGFAGEPCEDCPVYKERAPETSGA